MKKYFIVMISVFSLFSCQEKKPLRKKIDGFISVYMLTRAYGGRYNYGHPLCGGDPIGTLLGLNNDEVGHYTVWEAGKTYTYNAGDAPNAVTNSNTSKFTGVYFMLSNTVSTATEYKVTLLQDCSAELSEIYPVYCSGFKMWYDQEFCKYSNSLSSITKKGETVICTVPMRSLVWFAKTRYINCSIQVDVKGV